MAITKYIALNSGEVITLSSAHLWSLPFVVSNLPSDRNGFGYDAGLTNPSSVLNLTGLYDAAASKIGISDEIWGDFAYRAYTLEEMDGEYFQTLLAAVNGATEWLWGSFEEGGLGFINVGGNIDAIWHQGIITAEIDNITKYRYFISRSGIGNGHIDRTKIDDCVITLVDEGENRFPDVVIWCSHKDPSNQYFQLILNPTDLHYLWWYTVTADRASNYTNNCNMNWAIGAGSYPAKPWDMNNNSIELLSSVLTYDQFYKLGGFSGHDVTGDDDPFDDTTGDDDLGGDGDWNGNSEAGSDKNVDDIGDDAINSGFVTLYKPSKPQMQQFSDWLWTNITDSLSQQIKRLLANPLDGILFIATTHLSPPTSQGSKEIKFCGIGSGIYALTIPKQFKSYDCGDFQFLTVDGSYSTKIDGDTKTFLDYQPYSKAEVYLPCIGYKELDINDVIGSTIHLNYEVDWVSGACLAQLKFTRDKRKNGDSNLDHNILYEFQGNIYTNLPLSASDWKSFYSNVLSVGGGLASALSGNIGLGATQAVSSIASQQVSVQKSGNVAASYGYMGQQEIRIYITRPNPAIPTNYKSYKGYQSNKFYRLGDLSGYTEIDPETFWVGTKTNPADGITEEEAEMLKNDLASGFYL